MSKFIDFIKTPKGLIIIAIIVLVIVIIVSYNLDNISSLWSGIGTSSTGGGRITDPCASNGGTGKECDTGVGCGTLQPGPRGCRCVGNDRIQKDANGICKSVQNKTGERISLSCLGQLHNGITGAAIGGTGHLWGSDGHYYGDC